VETGRAALFFGPGRPMGFVDRNAGNVTRASLTMTA
jgi:hypothetical protein